MTVRDKEGAMGDEVLVTLDNYEQRLMVRSLNDVRNNLIGDKKPTEDLEDLILKVIDAPKKKRKRREER